MRNTSEKTRAALPNCFKEQMKDDLLLPTEEMLLPISVLEHSSDAFFCVGSNSSFNYVNATFCRWLGYSREELLLMTLPQVDEIFCSTGWDTDWQELRVKKSRVYESNYLTRSGANIPVQVEENYIELQGKEFHFVKARTLRKSEQFDDSIHQSARVLKMIFDSSADAHLMTNLEGKLLMFNKSANQMAKNFFSGPLHVDESITNTFYFDDSHNFKRIANLALNSKSTHTEKLLINHHGEDVWFDYSIVPICDNQSEVTGIWFTAINITDRKLKIEILQQHSSELSRLVDNISGYAVYMLDPTGMVASWNVGAHRLLGYRSEEILGKHFSCIYTRQDINRCLPDFEIGMAIKNGQHELEGWCIRKDGTRFWALTLLTVISDAEGHITGFSIAIRDISKSKREKEEQAGRLFSALNEY